MKEKKYEELEDMLCGELEKIIDRGEITTSSLDAIDKLTHALKNTYKIHMGYEGEYSGAGEWRANMGGTYGHGSSYDGYAGRRHSRDGDYSGRRNSRYSGARDDAMEHLDRAMSEARDPKERETIEKALRMIESM